MERKSFTKRACRYFFQPLLIAFCLALFQTFAWCAQAQEKTPTLKSPVGTRVHIIDEPVFQGQAYLYEAGTANKQTVVLIHGIGEKGARDWDSLIPLLAQHYHVLTFDLPGFGLSSKANRLYSPENYVAFVKHVVDNYAQGHLYLVGHSMGGAVALRYAGTYPRDVRALVLADVPGILHRMAYSQHLSHWGVDFFPSFYPQQSTQLRNLVGNILGRLERMNFEPEIIVNSPSLREKLLQASPTKIAGLALAITDFSEYIARIQAPSLIIWGSEDPVAAIRTGKLLAANIARARLEILEGVGHTPMDDVPGRFNDLVLKHLQNADANGIDSMPLKPAWQETSSPRQGECRKRPRALFEGDYDTLVINDCRNVVIRNARVRELRVYDAAVEIEASYIGGSTGGLRVEDSYLTMTGSVIEAPVAITTLDSKLDLAGVSLHATEAAVRALLPSRLLFSVSRVESPGKHANLHEVLFVNTGDEL